MASSNVTGSDRRSGHAWRNIALALLMCAVMTLGHALIDWRALALGRLPDNDDMMRLAEVRDWIDGQRFADMTQHRLGPPGGASMHWSRIADAGPAAFLLVLRPVLQARTAMLVMLVGYQALLLLAYILLAGRNARLIAGDRAIPIAMVLAAIAYPTITLFIPGRIDHHALQIVLMMVALGTLLAAPGFVQGLIGGIAAGISLAVGLEVAPELLALMGVMGLMWLVRRSPTGENARLGGFALGMGGVTSLLLLFARPEIWPAQWCDGFTPSSTSATLAASVALGALAAAGAAMRRIGTRVLVGAVVTAAAGIFTISHARACFAGPYGALDPYLQHAWMSNVAEARGLFYSMPGGVAVAYGGLCFAGLGAALLLLRDPATRPAWWPFTLFLGLNVIALILQIRVSYVLAGMATLPFAALLAQASGPREVRRRLCLWLFGSGVVWSALAIPVAILGIGGAPAGAGRTPQAVECNDGAMLATLGRMPPGLVIAPLDSSAYVIGMTPHRSLAAPYHRNNIGNLAMYRFFFASPDGARAIGRHWNADYVVTCADSLDQAEVKDQRPGSLIAALQAGHVPGWLAPVASAPGGMAIYRIRKSGGTL